MRPTSELYAETDAAVFGAAVPVAAMAGDQQAAMFGQLCIEPGMGKVTYGTSVMVGVNTGKSLLADAKGVFALALWHLGKQAWYRPGRHCSHGRSVRRLAARSGSCPASEI